MKKQKTISVRKIKEILRLSSLQMSQRNISRSVKVSRSTVQEYLSKAAAAGVGWREVESLNDDEIVALLTGAREDKPSVRPQPNYDHIDKELRRQGVTLYLLWEEYSSQTPDAYGYTNFCSKYRTWKRQRDLSYRKPHQAGERASVDYAGQKLYITDRRTGEKTSVEIFVCCLEASNYLYTEATLSQKSSDWIGSNGRALAFFGGAPKILVPDNLRAGVTSPCYYEPGINNAFQDFATHHNIAVIPARVRKPKDKGKVESGVQCVERRILAPLRDCTFFSLGEMNQAIWEKLRTLNNRRMQGYDCSRSELFASIDKPALQPLPEHGFVYKEVKQAKVNIDYHIEFGGVYYSVPYQLRGDYVEIHATDQAVEIYHKGQRVACHIKGTVRYQPVTDQKHMPQQHSAISGINAQWLASEAANIGPETAKQVAAIIASRKHPEQGYRACLGLIRLAKKHNARALESACKLANDSGVASYKRISHLLKKETPLTDGATPLKHNNLRGSQYYH